MTRQVGRLSSDIRRNQVAIYGNAGIAGAVMAYDSQSVEADADGNYIIIVHSNWSGTVTPSKTGYTFTPASKSYTNITASDGGEDYTAEVTTYTISGNAQEEGVTLTYIDGIEKTVQSVAGGDYSLDVTYNWSGTVTPTLDGYAFTPESKSYTNVVADISREDYTAEAFGAIYGVSWEKVESPTLTRTDDAVGMTAEVGIVGGGSVTNDFDTAEIYKDIEQVTDDNGNVFIRIPKFYIEKKSEANFASWRISRNHFGDAYLPKCFTNADYVDVGAYNASLDSGGTKLESKADTYPLVSRDIVQMRSLAVANGADYYQLDVHVYDVLQVLFFVEFATLDAQSVMYGFVHGRYNATDLATATESGTNRIIVSTATAALYEVGQTISIGTSLGGNQIFYGRQITGKTIIDASNTAIEFDGAAVNIATGNILYNTGQKAGWSTGLAAKSGSLNSNSTGKFSCAYRGIENPWGSVWQFVDGVNINYGQAWVCDTPADYVSNLFASPYKQLSYVNHDANGYAVEMGLDSDNPSVQFPISVTGGNYNKYYSDFYYRNSGARIALVGGNWGYGVSAGPSSWNLYYSSANSYVRFGGRLIKGGA